MTCHGTLLLIPSSTTSGDNNNLFMPVIDVSFNLKLVYRFKSWGDFIVYFPLTRLSISSPSLSSTELEMLCFQVKMTVCDKQYTFTHTHPNLLQKSHTHPNPPKLERKTLNCQMTLIILNLIIFNNYLLLKRLQCIFSLVILLYFLFINIHFTFFYLHFI